MDINRIVAELKAERTRLDHAIAALEGTKDGRRAAPKTRRRHRISAAGRKRISEAMTKRWAKVKRQAKAA